MSLLFKKPSTNRSVVSIIHYFSRTRGSSVRCPLQICVYSTKMCYQGKSRRALTVSCLQYKCVSLCTFFSMAHRPASRLAHLKVPAPLDRGEISGDLTDFSSINGALRAVKGTQEGDESHVDLTRYCSKSSDTSNSVLHRVWHTWKHRRR